MTKNLVIRPDDKSVLIAVDVQYDFLPGGALAVPGGDEVIPAINRLAGIFRHVVLTQDWHPMGHKSFASSHPDKKPFDSIFMPYGDQTLWPDHCLQGSRGAAFHESLTIPHAELIIRKGYNPDIDSYSAFFENDQITPTGLGGYLQERGMTTVFVAGLATDYCVLYSALDAIRLGFTVYVVKDACRGIDIDWSVDQAWRVMTEAGVEIITGDSIVAG